MYWLLIFIVSFLSSNPFTKKNFEHHKKEKSLQNSPKPKIFEKKAFHIKMMKKPQRNEIVLESLELNKSVDKVQSLDPYHNLRLRPTPSTRENSVSLFPLSNSSITAIELADSMENKKN